MKKYIVREKITKNIIGIVDMTKDDPQDLSFELAGLMTDEEVKSFSIECIKEA